jgi:inhibitor of KinA sporulation pathway (predicted exonuclease)
MTIHMIDPKRRDSMARPRYDVRRDRILFVDVEATCWDGDPPEGESREIIEFGIAEVDVASLEIRRTGSILVRPVRSTVSDFCRDLTGLDQATLRKDGRPLAHAVASLRKDWGVGSKAWFSWGTDRDLIDEDFATACIASPFSAHFTDLGFQFGALMGERSGVGLGRALELLGEDRFGRAHSGVSDAGSAAVAWIAMARRMRSLADTA